MQKDILQENYATIYKEYIHFNWWVFGPYDYIYYVWDNNINSYELKDLSSSIGRKYWRVDSKILIWKKYIYLWFKIIKDLYWKEIKYLDIINTQTWLDFRLKIYKYNLIYNTFEIWNSFIIINYTDENFIDKSIHIKMDDLKIIKEVKEKIDSIELNVIKIKNNLFEIINDFNIFYLKKINYKIFEEIKKNEKILKKQKIIIYIILSFIFSLSVILLVESFSEKIILLFAVNNFLYLIITWQKITKN